MAVVPFVVDMMVVVAVAAVPVVVDMMIVVAVAVVSFIVAGGSSGGGGHLKLSSMEVDSGHRLAESIECCQAEIKNMTVVICLQNLASVARRK